MKSSHIARGFSDIAQNITIFPDGRVAIGRPLNTVPAGIYGQNGNGICIENIGDFDLGKDQMTPEHKDSIIQVSAQLCLKFGLNPDINSIVYHHWFDLRTGQRTNGSGNTKSCPGSGFFGGNTTSAAQQNLILPVASALSRLKKGGMTPSAPMVQGVVSSAGNLNIRKGPGTQYEKSGVLPPGACIQIIEEQPEWFRISDSEWVSSRFVTLVQPGVINVQSAGVYAGPGGTYNLLTTLSKGDEVLVYISANGWSRIDFIDKWIKTQSISLRR
jgi:uncharacterized protein YraI